MKNEALEVLFNRRSIRKFKPEQIKDEELDLVLKAGTYAPTAKGTQSPLIVVVQNPDDVKLLDRLSFQIMMKSLGLNRDGTAYYGAPTIILVFATDRAMNEETGIIDAANATTNMVNAAYAVGLGSCWIHRAKEIFESAEGKALLNKWGIKEHVRGVASIALGYPDIENPSSKERREGFVIKTK